MSFKSQEEYLQLQIYIIGGVGLFFCGLFFSLIITLFIETRKLKKELMNKPTEVHRFNVPYIDPKEVLAKRGYSQYPQWPIALQH